MVAAHHTGILQGHWGEAKTTEIVRRRFWFPGMPAFIQDFIKKCDTCQRIKADRHKQKGLLMPLCLPELPWSSISIDWMRGLPPHTVVTTTYESILIVIDRCTKMIHLIPISEAETSEQTARLLLLVLVIPRNVYSRRPLHSSVMWTNP